MNPSDHTQASLCYGRWCDTFQVELHGRQLSTVDPWYPWICGSKETTVEETPQILEFSRYCGCLIHFSHVTQLPLKMSL
jgi:hypothetical protein